MFVVAIKASTMKFFGVVALALVLLVGVLLSVQPTVAADAKIKDNINYTVKGVEDCRRFLEQFGWTVSDEPIEQGEVRLPAEFDSVLMQYNEIQKAQNLNLEKYAKKPLMRYTYTVSNYEGYDEPVYANVLVYKDKVVGGDVSSASPEGFIHGFSKPEA